MQSEDKYFDVIIIGGGPAGMSAAITCAELGVDAILLEREHELGGQLLWTHNAIENYPPFRAKNGRELRDHFLGRVENAGVVYRTNAPVADVDLGERLVTLANGDRYSAGSIILATGVRRRRLNVPGEAEFRGRGILESGIKDKEQVRGKTVVIVGGGDAAVENAYILGEVAKKVILVHRRNVFTAQRRFVDAAHKMPNVEVLFDSRVTAIVGDTRVMGVETQNLSSGVRTVVVTDAVLIRIGIEPNAELFACQLVLDEGGYIARTDLCGTSLPFVYAAGDVTNPTDLTVAAATALGTKCAERTKI